MVKLPVVPFVLLCLEDMVEQQVKVNAGRAVIEICR
jgi:hypothetical protein